MKTDYLEYFLWVLASLRCLLSCQSCLHAKYSRYHCMGTRKEAMGWAHPNALGHFSQHGIGVPVSLTLGQQQLADAGAGGGALLSCAVGGEDLACKAGQGGCRKVQ